MKKKKVAQNISLITAFLFYFSAVGCLLGVAYYGQILGSNSPIVAALASSVVFFVGAGIVLHVIGRADLPDLSVK